MFDVKPPTAKEEFEQLHKLFGTADIAEVLDRRPESVSRLKKRASYTRPLERLIDDVWSVVHVATTRAHWPEDQVRAFLLLRQPTLDLRPAAELIRAGSTDTVLAAINATRRPIREWPEQSAEEYQASNAVVVDSPPPVPGSSPGSGSGGQSRRRGTDDPEARAAAQSRLAERGLKGLDRDRLIAAGREAWGMASDDS